MGIVAISANDVPNHSEDSPARMEEEACPPGLWVPPYLYDETQTVAIAYRAACTPDCFRFNAEHRLVYRGQFDDSRPGNSVPVTGKDLRTVLDAVLTGWDVLREQKPGIGCNLKWKAGHEPDSY